MILTERPEILLTILDDGQIEYRQTRVILEDGNILTKTHHRQVLEPGQDVSSFPKRIKDVTSVVWTQEVINKFREERLKRESLLDNQLGRR